MRNRPAILVLVLVAGVLPAGVAVARQAGWPMKAHDVRRTGQSDVNGPLAIDPARSWTAPAPAAHTINIGATVTEGGVFFGSWGLLRRDPDHPGDPRLWDKSDGQLFGLDRATGVPLWGSALDLDLVPRCYEYPDRGPNLLWCGLTPYEVSFYNGTVEGQPAYDAARNTLYVGRGDGRLFAVDPDAGAIRWRYVTFNPELPDDPDGGGEIVAAPLLGPDGTVYVGTWGEGPYETDAFYAVNPDGSLQWRYPAATSLPNRFFASPALSPDAATVYAAGYLDDDAELAGPLYAFHRLPIGPAPDADRLKWRLDLTHDGRPVWVTTLAVGSDGTVYVGGVLNDGTGVPIVTAVQEVGGQPVQAWSTPYVELRDGAQFVGGIALREEDGQTRRLYVTTANLGSLVFNTKTEGALYALDPATGAVLAAYDPSDDVPAAVGGLNSPAIGADGTVYVGVRGRFGTPSVDPINGRFLAVTYDAGAARFDLLWEAEVDGYVEWNHPAIGPDGGLYAGSSSVEDNVRTQTHDEGTTPEGSTAYFHAFKGPTQPVAAEAEAPVPSAVRLAPPYPNPFANHTRLAVTIDRPGPLCVEVVDLLGRVVVALADAPVAAGAHTLTWDGRDAAGRRVPAGVYVVRLRSANDGAGQARTVVVTQ